jgi:phage terminase large subunit GpA-like protein
MIDKSITAADLTTNVVHQSVGQSTFAVFAGRVLGDAEAHEMCIHGLTATIYKLRAHVYRPLWERDLPRQWCTRYVAQWQYQGATIAKFWRSNAGARIEALDLHYYTSWGALLEDAHELYWKRAWPNRACPLAEIQAEMRRRTERKAVDLHWDTYTERRAQAFIRDYRPRTIDLGGGVHTTEIRPRVH